MENDLVDHKQKLKVVSKFSLERDTLAKKVEEQAKITKEWARLVEEWAKQVEEAMESLKVQVASLNDLMAKVKEDCTRGYHKGVSFITTNFRAQTMKSHSFPTFLSHVWGL